MSKMARILCMLLVVSMMLFAFSACKSDKGNDSENPSNPEKPAVVLDPATATDEEIYDAVFGEFYEAYQAAKAENLTVAERYALMAVAEAKMLEAGVMMPMQANGGNYAISKVAPYTITPVLWGNDSYRYHNALIATEPIKTEDRDALKALYAEVKGTGTYEEKAKAYLEEHGYTLQRTYSLSYNTDPQTYDVHLTSNAADSEVLVNTYDGLIEYDCENVLQPALATEWGVSDDGLTWTFKLREGAKWVTSTKSELGEVTADDFVAGFQHMLDDPEGGLSWLVDGVVAGVTEYVNGETEDFADVGVKAVDDHTVEYTLTAPCSYFDTMFSYGVFAPLNRAFYTSQGGQFGFGAETGDYGTSKDTIAYCGPYIITSAVAENTFVFEKNEAYWNADNINIDTITWVYNSGDIDTQAYSDFKDGITDGTGLNAAALELAKEDGNFEAYGYVASTDATSFPGFFNIHRTAFANFNDNTQLVSTKDDDAKKRTAWAMLNKNFRLALSTAFDRGAYMEQSVGADLKYTSLVNSYTPGTFVALPEAATITINGAEKTYAEGTFYGQIMQDQITADGLSMKVFDPEQDGGIGSSGGYDGWYNPSSAKEYLDKAVAELADSGVEISADNPIYIDYPLQEDGGVRTARANVVKSSIEKSLEGKVVVNLVATEDQEAYLNATYWGTQGNQMNYDFSINSGWGPDYGDPSTYLDTMIKGGGYMLKTLGLDA